MVVVLPAPLGPRKATTSPGSIGEVDAATACTAPKSLVHPVEADGRDGVTRAAGGPGSR